MLFLSGCKHTPQSKHYPISGKVLGKSILTQEITLDGSDVPGFMAAMTMAYKLPDVAALEEIQPGDRISAQIAIDPANPSHFWLESVVITAEVLRNAPSVHLTPHELLTGEAVPDVDMVDQDNRTFHLRDDKGKAVLITFIYTRCPMPDFCPRISSNFSHIHDALKQNPSLYGHTQLVSITLDPIYDTPAVMRKYGLAYLDGSVDDLRSWTFASTSTGDLQALASAFGLEYFADGNQINHSMSTVLLSKDGRVAQVWKGNDWRWEDILTATEYAAQK